MRARARSYKTNGRRSYNGNWSWLLLLLLLLLLLFFGLFVGRGFEALVHDDGQRKIVQVWRLNLQVTDKFVFEGVLGWGVKHLLFDVGFVGTKDDESEFVPMTAFGSHITNVETSVTTITVHLNLLQVIPKGSVVSLGGGSVLAAGVVEHFVDDDFLEIIAESVDAVFVFALLFHQFVRVHALIRHFHSGGVKRGPPVVAALISVSPPCLIDYFSPLGVRWHLSAWGFRTGTDICVSLTVASTNSSSIYAARGKM